MNRFIKNISIYSSFVLLILYLLQYLLILIVDGRVTHEHDTLENTMHVNAELVFIGSSRSWAHFDPLFFQEGFNLKSINIGVDGHTELSMSFSRLVDYLKGNNFPKFVILSFDPFVKAGSFDTPTGNETHKNCFSRFAFCHLNRKWETIEQLGFNKLEKNIPLYAIFKYKQLNNCLFRRNSSAYAKYGYDNHIEGWDFDKYPMDFKMKNMYFVNSEIDEVKKALGKINDFCKRNKIKLICIQTAVFENIFDEEIFQIPKNICKELNIFFVDANIECIRKDIGNFYNSNHLNFNGVSKLNAFLVENTAFVQILHSGKEKMEY